MSRAVIRVVGFEPRWRADFAALNIEWLEHWFEVEPYDREVLGNPELTRIAGSLGRTPAQVSLRWILQNGVIPLPRTQKPPRMAENLALFDFEISEDDMHALNRQQPCGGHCADPDEREET